jgi:hypothetical protein
MRELGIGEIPVVVGGIIPPEDAKERQTAGVARAEPSLSRLSCRSASLTSTATAMAPS